MEKEVAMGQIDPRPNMYYDPTHPCGSVDGYHCCGRCRQWVDGAHSCTPWYPVAGTWSACNHCFCIDVPPSGGRTKPHVRCCHCGRTQVVL